MNSKKENEYRKNKKINKNKRHDEHKKKNNYLNNEDFNYNELKNGDFDIKPNLCKVINPGDSSQINEIEQIYSESKKINPKVDFINKTENNYESENSDEETFNDNYFDPVEYKK